MEAANTHNESKGVKVLGGKKDGIGVEAGDGSYWAHFLTPWGMLLELVSFPNGKDYMKDSERHLWRPDNPTG